MKRNKKLLISIVSVICSFVLVFASACAPETVTKTPESITINTTAVKTTYVVGETFTSAGLTATVNYNFSDGSKSSEATTDFEVNSTQFVSGTAGAYTISVTYTEGEATVSASYSVTVLSSATLEIDSSSVKTVYEVGETLDLSGLTANYVETKADNSKTTTSVTSTMVVDSSSVNMSNMGTYTVTVRYTKPVDNISVSATFAVEVKGKIGLDVALAADVSDTIILSATATTGSFDASQIVVRQPDQTGSLANSTPMASSDYTVEMYKAQEKLTPDAEGGTVYSNLSGGAYQVVANATISNEAVWGFALIYVVDNVSALTWDSTAEGTVTTQETSAIDSITETLKFTVTYTSGATKQVTADDVQFTTPVDSKTVGENLTATATYSEVNTKGESITTTPATVTYTITEKSAPPSAYQDVNLNVGLLENVDALVALGTFAADQTIYADDNTSIVSLVNSKITVSSHTFDGVKYTHRLQTSGSMSTTGKAVKVEIAAGATISVIARGKNERQFKILDSTGAELYVAPAAPDTTALLYTYKAEAAGTYYIGGTNGMDILNIAIEYDAVIVPPTYENVTLNVGLLENVADLVALGAFAADQTIYADDNTSIVSLVNSKITVSSHTFDGVTYTHRLQTSGSMSTTGKAVKVEIAAGATISVIARGKNERQFKILDSTGAELYVAPAAPDTTALLYTFEATEAGTYYIGGTNGMDILNISIIYSAN